MRDRLQRLRLRSRGRISRATAGPRRSGWPPRSRAVLFSSILLSALFAWTALSRLPQTKPSHDDYNSGAYLYRVFCSSCHGETGRGNGPAADLTFPPAPDLTTLQRRNGGVFPRERVRAVLEGRGKVEGHGAPAMPDWPKVLGRVEGGDERVVDERLTALTAHLEVLQVR